MNEHDILNRINQLCRNKGWSHYRLSQESGIPVSTLNNMFHRTNVPTIPTLIKLCHAFDMTLSQFFTDEPPWNDLTVGQQEILSLYTLLSPQDKELAKAYLLGLNHKKSPDNP